MDDKQAALEKLRISDVLQKELPKWQWSHSSEPCFTAVFEGRKRNHSAHDVSIYWSSASKSFWIKCLIFPARLPISEKVETLDAVVDFIKNKDKPKPGNLYEKLTWLGIHL